MVRADPATPQTNPARLTGRVIGTRDLWWGQGGDTLGTMTSVGGGVGINLGGGWTVRELDKPIGRVRRRLRWQRFLASLVWSLAGALALATVALAVERYTGRSIPGPTWWPFAAAAGLAVLVSAMVALVRGPDSTDAAVALDRAFGLNERLSTAITLPEGLRETPAGRALIADAIRHVGELDVATRFGLKLPERAWVPLVPLVLAGLILLGPEWSKQIANARSPEAAASTAVEKKAVTKQTTALAQKAAQRRQDMDKAKFAEAEKLLAQVEKAANDLAKAPPAKKDEALVTMNKLTDALKERQKQLGSPEQINRQLQQLQQMAGDGPADQFMKELAKGDYAKAAEELKQIKEKLASGKMTEKEKEALKQQVGDMAKQLEKLANLEKRKEQLEAAKKNGGLSQEQFDKEMAKLNDQAKKLENLQKMANQLQKAQEAMQKGDTKQAAEALGMSQQKLEQMAKDMQEMQALEGAMADLQNAKDGMSGEGQEGDGNQFGDNFNQFGQGNRQQEKGEGRGGRGVGEGPRPEAPDNVASYNTRSKNQYGKGAAVIEGTAPPTTMTKGLSQITIQGEVEAAANGASADALTNQKVPKSVEKHIRGYFDQINKRN